MVGERGAQLSAGERQLVALIRASLVDPDVPGPRRGDVVGGRAHRGPPRPTPSSAWPRAARSIAIAHRLSTAARADRVLVLDRGRLIEDGHHHDLVDAGGPYSRMYDAWIRATTTS